MPAHDTVIRRLRVRGHTADAMRMRLRAAAVIGGADLHPSSLDRASILCIRKLSDPRPRSLGLADHRVRPAADWELAARRNVSALAGRAVRPALGAVPASAEAVLFLDRAELLACLAADWIEGHLGSCWWWRALFGVIDVAGIVRAWRDTPEAIPAAFHLLAQRRQLDRFVRALPPADAIALTCDVARAFGIDAVNPVALAPAAGPPDSANPAATTPLGAPVRHDTVPRSHHLAAWARYVPQLSATAIAPVPRLLIFTALVLHRSPSLARQVLSAEVIDAIVSVETIDTETLRAALSDAPLLPRRISPDDTGEVLSAAVDSDAAGELSIDARANRQSVGNAPAAPSDRDVSVATIPAVVAKPPVARPIAETFETQFGGAFHLINVGIALGLYGDFTSPRMQGIDLPIWDFVVLVAAGLLDDDRFTHDPIVPFLARLAGRDSSERPGTGFPPDDAETLDEWLDALVPRIRDRVAAALAVPVDAAAPLMLCRSARVSLTPSHLDIAFALNDLPVAIRLAGLDRDPGFVPAAGLTITFSYV